MITLYKVGANGAVRLVSLATEGDFYTADKADDGTIVLSPVQVTTTSTKRGTTDEALAA